jgi:small GTP-binding protein
MSDRHPYRVVMIGDSQAGKTTIVSNLAGHTVDKPLPTVGVAVTQNLTIRCASHPTNITINLWDTAGQERYRSLGPMYYKNADAAVAVFDLTNLESFENLDNWVQTFRDVVSARIVCVLGNKSDLETERAVTDAQIQGYVQSKSFSYFPTSAITGDGIQEAFAQLADDLLEQDSYKKPALHEVIIPEKNVRRAGGCCWG